MGKIATEAEAAKIGGMPIPSTGNKGCTWQRAVADLNCEVMNDDDLTATQLVQLEDLRKASETYYFSATVGLGNSIYSSRLVTRIEFLLDGVVVGHSDYVDTDDSRDLQEFEYEDSAGKVQSIRFIGQPNSYVQLDSEAENVRVDYKSGKWKDIYTNQQGTFTEFNGYRAIIRDKEAEIIYTFNI